MNCSIQLWRNATLLLHIGPYRFLVDPMLAARHAMEPVQNAGNDIRIPTVDLPFDNSYVLETIDALDAVIVTHLHRDHWDARAVELIPKNKLIIAPQLIREQIWQQGFTRVTSFPNAAFPQLQWIETGGKHGTGETGKKMGQVNGFVVRHQFKSLYVAGDTIFCDEVAYAINNHHPTSIVLNAGAAQFTSGGPITMNEKDIASVIGMTTEAKIIAVHMEALNHCRLTRAQLRNYSTEHDAEHRLNIPEDGEWIDI